MRIPKSNQSKFRSKVNKINSRVLGKQTIRDTPMTGNKLSRGIRRTNRGR